MSFLRTMQKDAFWTAAMLLAAFVLMGQATPAAAVDADPTVEDDALTLFLADMGLGPVAVMGCSKTLSNSGEGSTCSCSASGPGAFCDCNGQTGPRKVCRCSDATGTMYCYYTRNNSTAKCRCDGNMPPWAGFGVAPDGHSGQDVRPGVLFR